MKQMEVKRPTFFQWGDHIRSEFYDICRRFAFVVVAVLTWLQIMCRRFVCRRFVAVISSVWGQLT